MRRRFRVALGVCLTNHFFCVPWEPHLLFRVAGTQQTNEAIVLITRSNLSTRLVARRAIDTAPAQSCQAERRAVGLGARRRSGLLSHQQRRQVVHRQRCLRYTNLVGRPNTGRSTNSTSRIQSGQSLTPDLVHVGQPDQQRAHSRSIGFQAGVPCNSTTSTSLRLAEPLWHAWDQPRTITQPSDAEYQVSGIC